MDNDTRSGFTIFGVSIAVAVIVVLVGFGIWAFLYVQSLNVQREGIRNSNEFFQSIQTDLTKSLAEYTTLDTKIAEAAGNQDLINAYHSQQKAIVAMMHQEADKLTPQEYKELSQQIRDFLIAHP